MKTEAQTKADEAAAAKKKDSGEKPRESSSSRKPKIRPLSEAKAIDLGANFVSESFLFVVGPSHPERPSKWAGSVRIDLCAGWCWSDFIRELAKRQAGDITARRRR